MRLRAGFLKDSRITSSSSSYYTKASFLIRPGNVTDTLLGEVVL